MRFDLTDMRLFLTVIERGSITAGAQAMHLALASASERIAGMEAALGAPLLERNRRGVQATAAGEAFVRHARMILAQVEQMRGELRHYATGLKGRIKLLSNTAALAAFLPMQLARFLAAHPDLSIDLDERPSVDIVQALAEGRADLGIVADITDLASLQTHVIAQDQLVVVAHCTHRVAQQSAAAFADIVSEAYVGLADAALEMHLAERASRLGKQLDYRIHMRSLDNVGMLVEAGIGIAILSDVSAQALRRPGLAIVPLSEPWAARRLLLCARAFDALTPHASLLAHQLIEAAA
ncbi:LysR substrate-binding domain-containing protein [Caballeronia sp. M1242]|uniref:LysR substrate-binding domain-containing protein n=1 Tax=Caballeronia sp. M1242 TaxID=2814653 RepID=UPI0019CF9E08|nr:LysR substrate-binding domain-containing protein [Caballeronia sp. M1242]QSN64732.1 LysR family transcriptional regulator [Caballeronia sp. M1242]